MWGWIWDSFKPQYLNPFSSFSFSFSLSLPHTLELFILKTISFSPKLAFNFHTKNFVLFQMNPYVIHTFKFESGKYNKSKLVNPFMGEKKEEEILKQFSLRFIREHFFFRSSFVFFSPFVLMKLSKNFSNDKSRKIFLFFSQTTKLSHKLFIISDDEKLLRKKGRSGFCFS